MTSAADSLYSAATARALELPSLLALLAELAATDLGRERLLGLAPPATDEELAARRRRYEEAAALAAEGRLVSALDFSVAGLLEELAGGRPAAAGALLVRLGDLLRATGGAARRVREAVPAAPALAELAAALPDLTALARRIASSLDARGQVREDASPELAGLRGRIRQVRDGLYKDLKRVVDSERDHLSEETIPMRGGRLVLVLSAGARGRLPGLVHGRSATGKSFYFEPLEVVEANNSLQQAVEDEDAERQRILGELLAAARTEGAALAAHAEWLAELDAQQAAARFAQLVDGRLAELAPRHELSLRAARHPLLDPALAELRGRALGQSGHREAIVPLDLELDAEQRVLVVTGPNAGGKTVALKTVGLLALATLCGLPVPVAAGSRVPRFARVVATVGDEQDLLADRSTFSGRLLRLKEAWEEAEPDSLVLLDELGSGTDPEEGAALALALLEGLLERRPLALITTHLTPVAAAALELAGAACAAMDFDPASGAPTYRLAAGPPGGSEALALARRLGLPTEWLDRAEERLGSEHRQLRGLLREVERLRGELAAERERLAGEAAAAERARAGLERERAAAQAEREAVGRRLAGQLEEFRHEVRRRLGDEVERLRQELGRGRRKGLAGEAASRLFAEAPDLAPDEPGPEAPLAEGGRVRHRQLGWEGVLEQLSGDRAVVRVRGKRLRCRPDELSALGGTAAPPPKGRAASLPDEVEVAAELNLIGQRVEPALEELDAYLDRALRASRGEVRIVHGHGTGRLRDAVRRHLRGHPTVAAARPGKPDEGGDGATVATLRGG